MDIPVWASALAPVAVPRTRPLPAPTAAPRPGLPAAAPMAAPSAPPSRVPRVAPPTALLATGVVRTRPTLAEGPLPAGIVVRLEDFERLARTRQDHHTRTGWHRRAGPQQGHDGHEQESGRSVDHGYLLFQAITGLAADLLRLRRHLQPLRSGIAAPTGSSPPDSGSSTSTAGSACRPAEPAPLPRPEGASAPRRGRIHIGPRVVERRSPTKNRGPTKTTGARHPPCQPPCHPPPCRPPPCHPPPCRPSA